MYIGDLFFTLQDEERLGGGVWEPEQSAPGRKGSRQSGCILSAMMFHKFRDLGFRI